MGEIEKIKEVMATDGFIIFVNIVRILSLVLVAVLIYVMISEIEAVKLLAYDPCKICMNKTGALCQIPFKFNP